MPWAAIWYLDGSESMKKRHVMTAAICLPSHGRQQGRTLLSFGHLFLGGRFGIRHQNALIRPGACCWVAFGFLSLLERSAFRTYGPPIVPILFTGMTIASWHRSFAIVRNGRRIGSIQGGAWPVSAQYAPQRTCPSRKLGRRCCGRTYVDVEPTVRLTALHV